MTEGGVAIIHEIDHDNYLVITRISGTISIDDLNSYSADLAYLVGEDRLNDQIVSISNVIDWPEQKQLVEAAWHRPKVLSMESKIAIVADTSDERSFAEIWWGRRSARDSMRIFTNENDAKEWLGR
jgi:hypothetical protein